MSQELVEALEKLSKAKKADDPASHLSTDEDASSLMNRIEQKFVVHREHLGELTKTLRENLKEGDIDTNVRFNVNSTIYLDNKDADIYRDTLDEIRPRFKVRIRRYAPNEGEWEDIAYVELKIKTFDKVTRKVRIRIPAAYIEPICEGEQIIIDETLFDLNRDISKEALWKRAAAMNSVISKYGLRKQIVVIYERRAYSNNNIRVTIDENLRYLDPREIIPETQKTIENSDGWKNFHKSYDKIRERDYLILEVKHEGDLPDWIEKLLKDVKAKKVKFSKYGASITAFLTANQASEGHMTRPLKIDADSILAQLGYETITKSESTSKLVEVLRKATKSDSSDVASIAVTSWPYLLMGKRRDNNRWTLPGGHLDRGEEKEYGAARELFEESGIEVDPKALKHLGSQDIVTFTGKHKKIHAFGYEHQGENPTTKNDPDKEVQKWEWIDISNGLPEEVASNLHSPRNIVLEKIGLQEPIEKAGGEGSRGGQIVGHTAQGKPIYEGHAPNIASYHPSQLKRHSVHVEYADENGIPKAKHFPSVMATSHTHAAQRVTDQFNKDKHPNSRITKIHVEPFVKKSEAGDLINALVEFKKALDFEELIEALNTGISNL